MASEMVMAHGDFGLELTPVEDVVGIDVLPVGPGGACTPACRRVLDRAMGGGVPTKLLRVKMPNKRLGRHWVSVRYACTPQPRYEGSEDAYTESGCQVCSLSDVDDPLFAGLTVNERARIARAVRRAAEARA